MQSWRTSRPLKVYPLPDKITTKGDRDICGSSRDRALNKARRRARGTEIRLQWSPGHRGLAGNEMVDLEAKAAASGREYPPSLVPCCLADYAPPLNTATLKRQLRNKNRSLAVSYWNGTTPGLKYRMRYPHLLGPTFLNLIGALPRARASLLFHLITGHVQLRQHLHRLGAVDSPTCEH